MYENVPLMADDVARNSFLLDSSPWIPFNPSLQLLSQFILAWFDGKVAVETRYPITRNSFLLDSNGTIFMAKKSLTRNSFLLDSGDMYDGQIAKYPRNSFLLDSCVCGPREDRNNNSQFILAWFSCLDRLPPWLLWSSQFILAWFLIELQIMVCVFSSQFILAWFIRILGFGENEKSLSQFILAWFVLCKRY